MAEGDQVFGLHAVGEVLRRRPGAVAGLLVAQGRADRRLRELLGLAERADVAVQRVPKDELDARVEGRHQGVIATLAVDGAPEQDLRWSEAQLFGAIEGQRNSLLLVLDGVTDPHNLGACLRSADAAGVHAVVIPKDRAADITPVVRKVACGATSTVPVVRVTNLARCLAGLKERGVWLYGAAGEAPQSLYDCDLTGAVAIVMGAEGKGLRRLTRECCDALVSLPMAGSVSSLNVSVATGVCLFEVERQRNPALRTTPDAL